MISLFEKQVKKFGSKTAFCDPATGRSATFRALDESARRVAAKLISDGFSRGDAAVVAASRGVGFVEAILGVLMAGGCYVPLSDHYPAERIETIRADCGAKITLDDGYIASAMDCEPLAAPVETAPEDPALIAYTSGSTGRPKGILHDHRGLTASVERFNALSQMAADDVWAANAPFYFIVHIADIFCPLALGMTAFIAPDALRGDPDGLADFIDAHAATGAYIPPKVLRFFRRKGDSLRFVITAGERLSGVGPEGYRLVNGYGMTETAGAVTAMAVDRAYDNTPIGVPMGDVRLYLLDEAGKRCDEGEICVSGPLGRGYLNLPEQTAETFAPNPFRDEDGFDILIHTGDLGRRLEDGNILYVNRRDWMVKINGQRVEPGEVEAAIRALDGVSDAAVRDFTDAFGDVYLAAYYLSDAQMDESALKSRLASRIPAYMIPAHFVRLDKFPLNANGKLDRAALPEPRPAGTESGDTSVENDEQRTVFNCLAAVVGHGRFGTDTPFEEAGLNSIGAIRLTQSLSDALGVPVSIAELRACPTVRSLAARLMERKPPENYALREAYPLTQTQMGVLAECLADPDSTGYNIPLLLKLSDKVDLKRLRAAVEQAVAAHPYLRLTLFSDEEGRWMAKRNDADAPVVELIETPALPDKLIQPYQMDGGRLYRARIYAASSGNYLFLDFHHILFDGASLAILIRDINDAYAGKAIEPERYTGFEAALDEEARRGTDALKEDKAYFDALLADADAVSLPLGDAPANPGGAGRLHRETGLNLAALRAFCQRNGATENAFFNAAFAFVLSRYGYAEDVLYTTVYNGRNDSRLARSAAMLVKTLPVAVKVAGDQPVADFVAAVGGQLMDSMSHDLWSFADIAREHGLRADLMLVYQGTTLQFNRIGGEPAEEIRDERIQAQRPLSLDIFVRGNRIDFDFEYDPARYSDSFVGALADALETVASEFMRRDRLREVSMLGDAAKAQIERFNDTDESVDLAPVHHLFEAQAAQHPDRTAVIAAGERLSYAELNRRANRIANALIARGLKIGETVGLLLPRTADAVAAEYGVWKAGGAFLPMLPDYPDDRIDYCATDSGSRFVIATDEIISERESLFAEKPYAALSVRALIGEGGDQQPDLSIPADSLAYCIYTSGSTGVPKGVMIEHGNLCNFVTAGAKNAECRHYVSHGRTALSVAALSFDFSLMEIHVPLCNGLTLCVATEAEIQQPLQLAALIDENGVDVVAGTPSFLSGILDIPETAQALANVKTIDLGAEAFPPTLYDKIRRACPEAVIVNGYGPTEATISCISKVIEGPENITIGTPAANVKAWICDPCQNILPPGAKGELVIGGLGVGRGYVNLPEKTAAAFIQIDGRRAYRSGDLARFQSNGEIEYFGRLDNQVKLHGLRIELDEIENVMGGYPGMDRCVVLLRESDSGESYLCGYFTADQPVDIPALKAHLAKRLARYMVPTAFVQLDSLPLTPNGKVDKKALPEPKPRAESAGGPAAPLNVLEQALKAMVAEIVGASDFGITDGFGDFGLSSLSGIRLAMLIYKRYGVQLDARSLISEGSIQSVENEILAALLNPEKPAAAEKPEEEKPASQACRLSFAQQGVYAEYQANPEAVQYNVPVAARFPEGVDAEQLEAAVRGVVAAHPYILCRFVPNEEDEIVQEPIPDFKLEIPVLELPKDAFEARKRDFARPFDLAKGPAVRFEIVKSDGLYLLADMHHLVCDGASMDIFFTQLCRALDGEAPEPERYSYYDFAAEEAIDPETEAFYAERMANVEEATRLIPDVFDETLPHAEKCLSVPTDIGAVKAFARQNGVTPAAVYLAGCYIAFARYVCEDAAAIATVSNGRSNLKVSDTMGMFVNTLPLAIQIDNAEKTADYLRRAAKDFSDAIAHEDYPFARIASKYDFHPAASFAYQIGVTSAYRVKQGPVSTEDLSLSAAKLPVSVFIDGTEEDARILVTYDSALYSAEMMGGFARSVENAVRGLMACETLSEISLTGEEEWKVLDGYNRPWDLDYDKNDTVATRFKRTAEARPDKVAAVFKDKSYTYRELDALTDRLAAKLYKQARLALGKNDVKEAVVAILLPRDENVFLLPLAAVKAGLAYEPLDPGYPKERLNFMVKDANACLLLAADDLRDLVDEYEGPVLTVGELYSMEDVPEAPAGPSPEDLFILLYTSGSTGAPKGCQIEHRNVVAYAHGVRDDFYTREDKIAAYASFGFDVNMSDVFCTLLNGGTVYLIPQEIRMDLGALAAYFDEVGITALLLTTQVGVQFLQNYPTLKTLRMLVMGGEKLPAVDPSKLSYTIVNGYGPTENCCGVSLFPIRAWEPNIPIGRPMATIHAYVLDKTGHRLPAGAAGEYCLSGPQVSRGYLNRPDKTAEAYQPCPFNDFGMYHTGDIVRYRQNGDVEFVGRKDGQVKIRGFRIETKEVESVIRGFAGVRDVTVQAYDYEGGGKYLAAFVVGDAPLDIAALTDYIKSKKPAYMVPAAIAQIDKIPLTVNQKVDKKALPAPKLQKAAYVAPEGKAEEDFCAIFANVLGVDRVGAEDDFFDAGGSSILAMKVVMAAEKAGYRIVYNDVFSHATPRAMAGFLKERDGVADQPAEAPAPMGEQTVPQVGRDGYDYHEIHAMLSRNTLDAFRTGERRPLNDVLLLGATGYLGSHVLHELIENHDGKILCLVRPGKGQSGQERLQTTLRYYFNDDFAALFGARITVVEGDATQPESLASLEAPSAEMTAINCAASVKHFARGDEIERANVDSVRNLTDWCLKNGARLIHISTGSVAGDRQNGVPPLSFRFDEHGLYAGQVIENNQYVHSKFMAERHIYEAIVARGLRAKVLRMGNLAPRASDGEFQVNYATNSYMNNFRAFQTLGMIGFEMLAQPVEFSPIDCLAKAVLALAETPDECVCFIPLNPHRPLMADVVRALNEEGFPVAGAEPEAFAAALHDALSDEKTREAVSSLAVYDSGDDTQPIGPESCDNSLTLQILSRLGFSWPETGVAYIRQFISKLAKKGYFGGSDA